MSQLGQRAEWLRVLKSWWPVSAQRNSHFFAPVQKTFP